MIFFHSFSCFHFAFVTFTVPLTKGSCVHIMQTERVTESETERQSMEKKLVKLLCTHIIVPLYGKCIGMATATWAHKLYVLCVFRCQWIYILNKFDGFWWRDKMSDRERERTWKKKQQQRKQSFQNEHIHGKCYSATTIKRCAKRFNV